MKLSLAYQKLLGSGDGIAVGNSNYPVVKPGQYYYVRPIIGPIKEGTLVKSVAKRRLCPYPGPYFLTILMCCIEFNQITPCWIINIHVVIRSIWK